jgi:hypothetical protein
MPIALTPAWGYSLTRAQWRALVRAELGDENAAAYPWSTALLDEWLNEAIRDFARTVPRELEITLTTVAGQAAYALPNGFVEVVRVEHPSGTFRTFRPATGGEWRDTTPLSAPSASSVIQLAYDVWQGRLVLDPAPTPSGEPITVRSTGQRAEPSGDTDPLPVELQDSELLLLYTCARAMQWISGQEAKRQAFERDRGATAQALQTAYQARYAAALQVRQRTHRPAPHRLIVRA